MTGIVLGLLASHGWAASLQYTLPGSPVIFADSAQTPTRQWTLTGLPAGQGRLSAQHDRGAGAGPSLWEMRCRISLTGSNTTGQSLELYIATADGTTTSDVDGGLGTADAALTAADKVRNLLFVGTLIVDQATTNTTMVASFRGIYLPQRYFSLVIWNNTVLAAEASTTKHRCEMTPVPYQMQ
jgi:hypothetical protein